MSSNSKSTTTASEILKRNNRPSPLAKQGSGLRENVIKDLLNWNDTNIQQLLSNLDNPDTIRRTDDYDEIRHRMDKLFANASQYKALSHTEMEEIISAFEEDSLSPELLEELANNEDFKLAFQKAALTRIPSQVSKLFQSVISLLDMVKSGRVPSKEEEERVFKEAQSVVQSCTSFQAVMLRSASQESLTKPLATASETPSSKYPRKNSFAALAAVNESEAGQSSSTRPKAAASQGEPRVIPGSSAALYKLDQSPAVTPKAAVSSDFSKPAEPVAAVKAIEAAASKPRRVATATISTQTDAFQTEPIVELAGQRIKAVDLSDIRRFPAKTRTLSISSSSSAASISGTSTVSAQDSATSNTHAAVDRRHHRKAKEEEPPKPATSTVIPPVTSRGPHTVAAHSEHDHALARGGSGMLHTDLVSPSPRHSDPTKPAVLSPTSAATGSTSRLIVSSVEKQASFRGAAAAEVPAKFRRSSLVNTPAEQAMVSDLLSQLTITGDVHSIDEEHVGRLLTPYTIAAIHNHFNRLIKDMHARKAAAAAAVKPRSASTTVSSFHSGQGKPPARRGSIGDSAAQGAHSDSAGDKAVERREIALASESHTSRPPRVSSPLSVSVSVSVSASVSHGGPSMLERSRSTLHTPPTQRRDKARRSSLDTSITTIEFRSADAEQQAQHSLLVPAMSDESAVDDATLPALSRVKSVSFTDICSVKDEPPKEAAIPRNHAHHNHDLTVQSDHTEHSKPASAKPLPTKLPELSAATILIPPKTKVDQGTMTDGETRQLLPAELLPAVRGTSPEMTPFAKGVPLRKIVEMESKLVEGDVKVLLAGSVTRPLLREPDPGYVSDSSGVEVAPPGGADLSLIESKLRLSSSPLLDLHHLFSTCMSPLHSAKLLAATIEDEARGSGIVDGMFGSLLRELRMLEGSSSGLHQLFRRCEQAGELLFHTLQIRKGKAPEVTSKAAEAFYSLLGQAESGVTVFDIRLAEFRSVFESFNAQGLAVLPRLVKTNASFAECMAVFTVAQSMSIEFKKKLNAAFDFSDKMALSPLDFVVTTTQQAPTSPSSDTAAMHELRTENAELRDHIKLLSEDVSQLEQELFEVSQSKDRTPSALLFFAALDDMATMESLQQLSAQLKRLKAVADLKEHMDFVDVRRRLQVCVASVPYVDRFIATFGSLHQRWVKQRLAVFEKRLVSEEEIALRSAVGDLRSAVSQSLRVNGSSSGLVSRSMPSLAIT